jgi:flavodoxin
MSKVIVVYESLLGNTRSVAEKIVEGAKLVPGNEVEITTVKNLQLKDLEKYDKILIGSPTHMGRPTRDTRNLVEKLTAVSLKGKTLAFFNCWSVPKCEESGIKSLEEAALHSAPGAKIVRPGLSVRANPKGPVETELLQKAREFGSRVTAAK